MKYAALALAAIAALALPAAADVVTVVPDPQPSDLPVGQVGLGETTLTRGWSIVTNALGWGKLSTYGPSTYQSRSGAFYAQHWTNRDPWFADQDLGRGAFYATTDFFKATAPLLSGDWTPSTVWLGTDQWNGQSVAGKTLGSITSMGYFSFASKTPTWNGGLKSDEEWWGKISWWRGNLQPIQLILTIQSPDGSETRQLWYRPWGGNYAGDNGLSEPGSKKGRWHYLNCLTMGKWYMPCTGTTPNNLEYGWPDDPYSWPIVMDFQLPDGPLPAFREWKLVSTAKTPGWNDQTQPTGTINATGTGKPINFFLGARVSLVTQATEVRSEDGLTYPLSDTCLFLQFNPGYPEINTETGLPYPPFSKNWAGCSNGARCQMDYFTLGFDNVDETYNFEPPASDPLPHIISCSHKSLDVLRSPIMSTCNQWTGNLFRVTGKVSACNNQYFELQDGSALTYVNSGYFDDDGIDDDWVFQTLPGGIRVYIQPELFRDDPYWISIGDRITAVGYIEPLRFAFPDPPELGRAAGSPLMMWTNMNYITVN